MPQFTPMNVTAFLLPLLLPLLITSSLSAIIPVKALPPTLASTSSEAEFPHIPVHPDAKDPFPSSSYSSSPLSDPLSTHTATLLSVAPMQTITAALLQPASSGHIAPLAQPTAGVGEYLLNSSSSDGTPAPTASSIRALPFFDTHATARGGGEGLAERHHGGQSARIEESGNRDGDGDGDYYEQRQQQQQQQEEEEPKYPTASLNGTGTAITNTSTSTSTSTTAAATATAAGSITLQLDTATIVIPFGDFFGEWLSNGTVFTALGDVNGTETGSEDDGRG